MEQFVIETYTHVCSRMQALHIPLRLLRQIDGIYSHLLDDIMRVNGSPGVSVIAIKMIADSILFSEQHRNAIQQQLGRLPPLDYPKGSLDSPYRAPPQESRLETDFPGSEGPRYKITWVDFGPEGGLPPFPESRENPILIVNDDEEHEDTVKMEDQCSPPQMAAASSPKFMENSPEPPRPQATTRGHARAVPAQPATDHVAVNNSLTFERAHSELPPSTVKQVHGPPKD